MPIPPELALKAELAATLVLTGLIWTIQIVHYPLMARVGRDVFVAYEAAHVKRIGGLVAPLMAAEAVLATAAIFTRAGTTDPMLLWAGLGLLGVVWLVTALLSVPCHARLERGFDERAHARLVNTNWLRTAAWTARSALLLWQLP